MAIYVGLVMFFFYRMKVLSCQKKKIYDCLNSEPITNYSGKTGLNNTRINTTQLTHLLTETNLVENKPSMHTATMKDLVVVNVTRPYLFALHSLI